MPDCSVFMLENYGFEKQSLIRSRKCSMKKQKKYKKHWRPVILGLLHKPLLQISHRKYLYYL